MHDELSETAVGVSLIALSLASLAFWWINMKSAEELETRAEYVREYMRFWRYCGPFVALLALVTGCKLVGQVARTNRGVDALGRWRLSSPNISWRGQLR